MKHGKFTFFYENGQKHIKCSFNNDLFHGSYRTWHPTGKREQEGSFDNGIRGRNWLFFDTEGVQIVPHSESERTGQVAEYDEAIW